LSGLNSGKAPDSCPPRRLCDRRSRRTSECELAWPVDSSNPPSDGCLCFCSDPLRADVSNSRHPKNTSRIFSARLVRRLDGTPKHPRFQLPRASFPALGGGEIQERQAGIRPSRYSGFRGPDPEFPASGFVTILLWFGIVAAGRWIAYV
jgi:hypothetical protein